ncbi:MAG: SPASM domain-containing protein, partial [Deltaproteobacteria bacterium]|nr:SPASM domain-containing protein [Deltaproteobacteria bacterium]
MLDFGFEVGANEIRFTPIDIVPGQTDCLLLSSSQQEELITILKENKIGDGSSNTIWRGNRKLHISGADIFVGRIKSRKGISVDHENIKAIPCTIGWSFMIIHPNGEVIPCCKGGHHPLGNVLRHSIKDIWQSCHYV